VAEKTFRADLYYRMAVVPLTMPPLRDRTGDVDRLVSHYWQVFTQKFHKPDLYLQPEVRSLLAVYDWPGNIRELRNLLEQLIILSGKQGVRLGDLPNRFHQRKGGRRDGLTIPSEDAEHHAQGADRPLADAVDALEIKEITRALEDCQGVKAKAAKQLGISRYALLRKIKRYRLA
jgi:transcriptional regulator with PAS, ATPase and Fis domain